MTQHRNVVYLLITIAAIFFIPYFGLYLAEGKIPECFFHFPATEAEPKPGPNLVVIIITSAFFAAFLLLLFVPRLFGFRKSTLEVSKVKRVKLPSWFWIGLIFWLAVLIFFIGKFDGPKWITNWSLIPLWWGFIHMLDGIVYSRNGGKSLVNDAPTELIAMGVLSISGWLIFEYFNFFIKLNWYYPAATLINHDEFLLYAIIGSSAFIPMAFEWYHLLRTFPSLNFRYKFGPKVQSTLTTKVILLILSFGGLFFVSFSPNSLFYTVWLSPLTILIVILGMLKIWTPFTPIKEEGDWTALIVFTPVWLIQGLFVESWNYLSYDHTWAPTYNPGYWEYCIPFVDFKNSHIFNMPFLGYLGYVPFSIYCFIWFIGMSFLMNISNTFSFNQKFR